MDSRTRKILNKLWRGKSFKRNGCHWKTLKNKIYFNEKEKND